jgi:hypothetical protein
MLSKTFSLVLWILFCVCLVRLAGAQGALFYINGPGSTLAQSPRPSVPHSPRMPYGLQLMARFDLLPLLRDTRCVQDSSYDRSGGNGDSGHFLRQEGDTAVLADIRGPGCIYRFWSANAAGNLRIYFDGEATPRIACPMQDLFLGKVTPFVAPLVGHKSGGWYCFFPIPFVKSCRIEVTDPGSMYYHVEYQLFPDKTRIRTFTSKLSPQDQQALHTVLDQWNHLGDDPKLPAPATDSLDAMGQDSSTLSGDRNADRTVSGNTGLAAGETRTVATLTGAGEVGALRMKITPADRYTLRQTVLRVYWDGAQKPGIEAPVGDFFGGGFGDQRFAALPCAMTDDGYACFWPMPFAHSARVELFNAGTTALTDVAWNITYRPVTRPLADVGYFHAQWHRQTTVAGEHFHILQTTGRGHYVGEHTDMQGDRGIWFLEGDEKFYVDGETFPSIYGTGTEDFYTGGWYFDEGTFNLAYHGCTLKSDDMSRVAAYRFQIQDCVPFQHDLKVDIEHGGMNDYPGADYACVAYWYQTTPDHDWSPIQTAQLTPAVMKFAGVLEAENLTWTAGNPSIVDDRSLPEEASSGKVVMLTGGEAPHFDAQGNPLDVPFHQNGIAPLGKNYTALLPVQQEDVYDVGLYQLEVPGTTRLTNNWWLDSDIKDSSKSQDAGALEQGERSSTHLQRRLGPGMHTLNISLSPGTKVYLDYITLTPHWREKGVIEAESLLNQADTGGKGTVLRQDLTLDWSGGSALIWRPKESGATLKLPFSVPADTDYALDLGVTRHPGGPIIAAKIDDGESIGSLDTYAATINSQQPTDRLFIGRAVGLKQGAHTLTLVYQGQSAGTQPPELWLDYFILHKSLYPYSIEAEDLKILDAKDGEATHQEMEGFGPHWSNDDQFWFIGRKAGAEATLELPVSKAGNYNLAIYYTTSRDYATVQVLIDGQPIGPPTDTYTADVRAKGKTALGTISLTAGAHRITFRAVGRNPLSSNYLIGVDAIGLEPVP